MSPQPPLAWRWALNFWRRLRGRFSKPWEKHGLHEHLICLVGYEYGPHPEDKIEEIRADKAELADCLAQQAGLTSDSVVIEIGSGMGWLSSRLAPSVRHLHCADISSSFLAYSRQACANFSNVSFHKLATSELQFAKDSSVDAVVSHAVFIHLDLFAIYWYLSEAYRILRPGGVMAFDINSLGDLNLQKNDHFHSMARIARRVPPHLRGELMTWNCPHAIETMATYIGLIPAPKESPMPLGYNLKLCRFLKP